MSDEAKSKQRLAQELAEARRQIAKLEAARRQYEQQLQEFRDQASLMQSMFQTLPLDFWARDLHARCIAQSDFSKQLWGNRVGQVLEEDLDGQTRAEWQRVFEKVVAGEVVRRESRQILPGGEPRDYLKIAAPVVEDGQVVGVLGIDLDVTDQKRADAIILAQRDLATRLNATSDLDEAIQKSIDAAVNVSGLDCGCIYLIDKDGGLNLAASRGLSDAFVQGALRFEAKSPQVRRIANGQSLYTHREELSPDRREACRREGLRAIAVLPVEHEGRVVACLTVASHSLDRAPAAACHALEGLSALIGAAVARLRAEEASRESQEDLRLYGEVIANMAEGVVIVRTTDAIILYTNPRFDELFGYEPEELVGKNIATLNAASSAEAAKQLSAAITAALRRNGMWEGEIENLKKDGTPFWCRAAVSKFDSSRFGRVWVGVHADITQRKEAEAAVLREQKKLRRLLDLHERDRNLIAYEIHDGFTQKVVGARLLFEAFRQVHPDGSDGHWKSYDAAVELVRQSIDDARTLINGVRPPVLDGFGLVTAIEHLVHDQERAGCPSVEFLHEIRFDRLDSPLECSIFRIVQESLTNACRHSKSDRVEVRLNQIDGRVRVEVQDWGIGFDPASVPPDRFGLEGIHERAQIFGGKATIATAPGKGTHVIAEVPIGELPPE